jgi:membrane protein DedA with SNARE-associated domain
LWSACWVAAGYVLGSAAERLLGDLARLEYELFAGVLVLVVAIAVIVRIWQRRSRGR